MPYTYIVCKEEYKLCFGDALKFTSKPFNGTNYYYYYIKGKIKHSSDICLSS